ncbi:efflux RND transporter permease subunit [Psychrosphaera sp. 1_MG-2023]|uniref:efflux RND transporter permease subunit n=1 Tax=Psychrosphaera sp. 1_MG-2023 TaxID=3062643 RepID=UPI0026E34219|nr:efflux RND transporter permease subunit [Psychrosphaera sp. 1_MG-2023]MDO6721100.1 efflux RND transporter permease subunit [Psychrosphaera sp. 1_MG-2023]
MKSEFDIAGYFIKQKTTSWLFTLILLVAGILSYSKLGQLEDPEFILKQAIIITTYPGASPVQVEEEITYPLENEIQKLPFVDNVKSITSSGMSQIIVEMKSTYRKTELRQIWDELRRKINDFTPKLPAGSGTPIIKDDFGDVYGVLMAVTGDGFNNEEINSYVDYIRRELVLVEGVGKVTVEGKLQEQVILEISHNKMVSLDLSAEYLYQILAQQNVVSNAGFVRVGNEDIRFHPTGEFTSVEELGDIVISPPGSSKRIILSDIATIYKDFVETPNHIVRHNSKPAIYVGLSFMSGSNVVKIGERVQDKLKELDQNRPYGMEINTVYNQPVEVEMSVAGFIQSLLEAVVIVIVILLLFMGVKTGLLIGGILLLTVLGTFVFMQQMGIELHRVSLGALIIALGMLVDNAIVVVEGILVGMQKRLTKVQAASLIIKQTKWPLLAATFISIIAFAPIGLSPDATGEFAGSLFDVLLISLLLSWVTAITITPFFASLLFKDQIVEPIDQDTKSEDGHKDEPYKSGLYAKYKSVLKLTLRFPKSTMALMFVLFVFAVGGFGFVKQAFFPSSNLPVFYLDYRLPEGADIRATSVVGKSLEQYVMSIDDVEFVSTTVGRGAARFMLTYNMEMNYANYGQLIVRVKQKPSLIPTIANVRQYVESEYPDVEFKILRVNVGPGTAAKIEARFSGPDPLILRSLSDQAKQILWQDSGAKNITDDWKNMTKVIRPKFNAVAAREMGVTKTDVDNLLQMMYVGKTVGVYREATERLPIVIRMPEEERVTIERLEQLQIYSPVLRRYVPITHVISEFNLEFEDPIIKRRDRKRTLTVMADHDLLSDETAAQVFARVKPKLEKLQLPNGYELTWGGEYEASKKAKTPIFSALPLGFAVMFIITILLFNSLKIATVIWSTVPLAIIGVTIGFLATGIPFGFMSLLGLLSLSGMLIKNGIVLVEQINLEKLSGMSQTEAIIQAAISRVRPVSMAAITTVLGMVPLLGDDFFKSMAVVIMFGLSFATVLTLIVVPVMYSLLIKSEKH